jgi:Mlc titration factor MtfA (ptsG expression regulator)
MLADMFGLYRWLRRKSLSKKPFPHEWLKILQEKVPYHSRLTDQQQARVQNLLKIFVWEKHFIGAQGFEITDEVRVVVAACAVRLVRFLNLSYYNRLTEIIIYPYHYTHKDNDGIVLGEAHSWGTVVLSWPAVVAGITNQKDGLNTALHEFAHVLDRAGGSFNGTPELLASEDYRPWAQVMSRHFLALRARSKKERNVLRMYGATNEAEFFAVATESFFEKPRQMKKQTPDLYRELQDFYGADPASSSQ